MRHQAPGRQCARNTKGQSSGNVFGSGGGVWKEGRLDANSLIERWMRNKHHVSQPAVALVVSVLLCSTPFIWFLYISCVMFFLSRNLFLYCAAKRSGMAAEWCAGLCGTWSTSAHRYGHKDWCRLVLVSHIPSFIYLPRVRAACVVLVLYARG